MKLTNIMMNYAEYDDANNIVTTLGKVPIPVLQMTQEEFDNFPTGAIIYLEQLETLGEDILEEYGEIFQSLSGIAFGYRELGTSNIDKMVKSAYQWFCYNYINSVEYIGNRGSSNYVIIYPDNSDLGIVVLSTSIIRYGVGAVGYYNFKINAKISSSDSGTIRTNFQLSHSYYDAAYDGSTFIITVLIEGTNKIATIGARTNTNYVRLYLLKSQLDMSTVDKGLDILGILTGAIDTRINIADSIIVLSPQSFLYDGQYKEPSITVTMDDTVLTRGVDYLATYENNLNPGTAHVLVAGIGDYTGSKRVDFTIYESEPPTGIDYRVTLPRYSYDYTGEPITPYVNVVTINGVIMVEGTDYVKTYQNNTGPGQASVLVAGIGEYADSGSKIVYFNIVKTAPDPYSPIGPSGPSDNQGSFDPVSDDLPQYTIPTFNLSDTGFTRIFNPTLTQIRDLASYMWTDQTFFETLFNKLIQVFENPMDAIIAFNIVPCEIPDGGTTEFKVLYIPTGIQMTYAAQQYVSVDCGSVTIQRMFGSAIDFNPYTKIKAYLPYIGMIDLDTDECMGKTLRLVYTIDIVSGSCVAQIYVDGDPLYQFSGHCAQYIPLAASDFSNYASAITGIAKLAVGAAAAGGSGAAAAVGSNGLQMTGKTVETSTSRDPNTGRQIKTGTVTREEYSLPPTQTSFASQAPGLVANTLAQVISSKIGIQHTSGFTGASGYIAYRQPFVNIEYPSVANPANYGAFNGRPCMMSLALNQLTGYTVIQQIQLTGFTCTQPELEELNILLKGGVVF